jgi:hypothetical protein
MSATWEDSKRRLRRVRELLAAAHGEARATLADADMRSQAILSGDLPEGTAKIARGRLNELSAEREKLRRASTEAGSRLGDCARAMKVWAEA